MSSRRTERGQTLPLVALMVITLMVAAAFSVDLGSLAASNRRLQAVADLAAIDGARELTGTACADSYLLPADVPAVASTQFDHVQKAVDSSAKRNSFVAGGDKTLAVELGTITRDANGVPTFTALPNLCSAPSVPDSVRVRAGDRTGFGFAAVIGQNGRASNRAGVGTLEGRGSFRLGSSVATIDTTRSKLLNSILSQGLCDPPQVCTVNLSAVSYNGLAATSITYGALAAQLGFGTTSELFNANLTVDQILGAAATLVGPASTAFAALNGITAAVTSTATIKLLDLVTANLASGNEAAGVGVNLFDLVTGSTAVANGTNALSIPNTVVTIPGVSSVTASVSLVEAPVTIGRRAGATRTTKQLAVTLTPVIGLSSQTLVGLTGVSVSGSLPITLSGGIATGTLTRVRCGANKGIDTTVAVTAANLAATGSLTVSLSTSGNTGILNVLGALLGQTITSSLSVSGAGVTTATGATTVSFSNPSEFSPPAVKHVGNTTIGLDDLTYGSANLSLNVPLLLSTTVVNLSVNAAALAGLLTPVLTQIDNLLVQPLMDVLGLDLGAADVWPVEMKCGVPGLAG